MSGKAKIGLVLSGGGAKGAYQAGVVNALADLGTDVDMLSGASIGALNGAVLASAPNFQEGARRLKKLWLRLTDSPLQANAPSYLSLLASAGLHLSGAGAISYLTRAIRLAAQKTGMPVPKTLKGGLLTDQPLREMLEEYVDIKAMSNGMPLYISVYPSQGGLVDALRVAAAGTGVIDTPESRYVNLQSLPLPDRKEALLASAAIPLLYAPKTVNGMLASDGGQGGWQKQRSNTPAKPLVAAGCNFLLVTHLNDGSLWSRRDFPETTVLEVRPQSSISRNDGLLSGTRDTLGFKTSNIRSWIDQGYSDCMSTVKPVIEASAEIGALRRSSSARDRSISKNSPIDSWYNSSISWLDE